MRSADEERRHSFEVLYRATLPSVRSYARRRAAPDVAEDVVASTFLTAWRRYDEAMAGGLPWLYRTARFTLANHQRSERRQVRVAQRVQDTTDVTAPDAMADVDERSLVLAAIQRLNQDDREVLQLVYWEHLTVKAVAVVLECRPGTAAVRLHRARRKLRDALSAPPDRPAFPVRRPTIHSSEVTP